MRSKSKFSIWMLGVVILSLVLTACQPTATTTPTTAAVVEPSATTAAAMPTDTKAPEATATTAAEAKATDTKAPEATATTAATETKAPEATATSAAPAATATIPPAACAPLANPYVAKAGELGSPDKPIVMAFVPSGDSGKIAKASTALADCLSKVTGLTFKIQTGTSFAAAVEAMGAEQAQVGFLNTFAILGAQAKYGIVPALINIRNYATIDIDPDKDLKGQPEPFYKGQFLTKADSGIKSIEDLKGKTFCFVDPLSTSGYIIPRIIMKAHGIDPDKDLKASVNAGSHPNVATSIYNGDCDAGITFIDVRTDKAANLQAKFPDITEKVVPFAVTDRIPNDGVQYVKSMDPKLQDFITEALLSISKDPGGKVLLAGLYSVNAFQKLDATSTYYSDFQALLQKAGVDPASLIK